MKFKVCTAMGGFTIETYEKKAPISSRNFQAYVENEYLHDCVIERLLTPENDINPRCKVSVMQWGIRGPARCLDPIAHEPTSKTGLLHLDGTVSLARPPDGTGQGVFFICIGDQPDLDFGSLRYEDEQGFAAFGQVIEGMDIVKSIYALAETQDYLQVPIAVKTVTKI